MKVFKWVLIGLFGLLLIFGAVFGVGVYLFNSIEPVKLTLADFDVGGDYTSEDRSALLNACVKNAAGTTRSEDGCTCAADKAATELSRYDRMFLQATFDANLGRLIALGVGAAANKIPREKDQSEEHISGLFKSCGLSDTP